MICRCSKKLVILTKRVLNLSNLFMLIKQESLILIFVFSLLSRTNLKLRNIIATLSYTKIKKLQLISLRRLDLFVFPWFFRTLSLSFHLQMIVCICKNFIFQIATKTLSRPVYKYVGEKCTAVTLAPFWSSFCCFLKLA